MHNLFNPSIELNSEAQQIQMFILWKEFLLRICQTDQNEIVCNFGIQSCEGQPSNISMVESSLGHETDQSLFMNLSLVGIFGI